MNAPSIVLLALCFLLGVQAYNYRAHPKVRLFRDIPLRCVTESRTRVRCGARALLAHPDDCGLFYHCVAPRQRPLCRQCPADLHFNPDLHVCDWPQVAGCTVNATSAAAPNNATSPAPPNTTTSTEVPNNATSPAPPNTTTSTEVPNNATSPAPPNTTTSAEVPNNATSPGVLNNATSSAPPSNTTWTELLSNATVTLEPNDS